ncbi:hypothetical protein Tco_0771975 [Tanacetum coccineum]|uniref:Uncharacterized protein n=1 Tax=Tanacetum coccineum TaxID=301880 RepID=A0ABQ4ZGM0_9ASTR
MRDEHLSTFHVEEIVPIPRESEDTFDNNKGCDLTFCDNNKIFSNPLFGSKDDLTPSNDNSILKEDVQEENFRIYSNPLFEIDDNYCNVNPPFKEMVDDVEIKNSNVSYSNESVLLHTPFFVEDECYYDSEGDVFYLESLLSDDTTYNLSQSNDPLHHEFTGGIITTPSRIAREHEEYLSLMLLLCGNSSSQPTGNFHVSPNTNIESLSTSPISIEESNSLREEIDIFSGPDDSIPPGIENDDYDSEDGDNSTSLPENESFTLDHFHDPASPRPPPKPPDDEICLNVEPETAVKNSFDVLNDDNCFDPRGGEIVVSQNIEDDDSFTFVIRTFLPFPTYPKDSPLLLSTRNEDTIFDPDISVFIFLLKSRWYSNVQWKFVLPHVSSPRTNEFGDRVELCDSVTKNKALHGRHLMLIYLFSFFFLISNVM